jgi:hypothetical protein
VDDVPAVKVGVRLPRQPDDLGAWFADAAAFEAAGVAALWVDFAPELDLDPLAITAALAAVTYRSLLVTTLPPPDGPSPALARTLATIGRLSHGRLGIHADAVPLAGLDGTGLDGTGLDGIGLFRPVPADPAAFEHVREPGGTQRWISAPFPDSRATWRAALLDTAERGYHGLLVPADPRLLDILRNPDDPDHRHDLQLAQG